jgi:hypothetical protein
LLICFEFSKPTRLARHVHHASAAAATDRRPLTFGIALRSVNRNFGTPAVGNLTQRGPTDPQFPSDFSLRFLAAIQQPARFCNFGGRKHGK